MKLDWVIDERRIPLCGRRSNLLSATCELPWDHIVEVTRGGQAAPEKVRIHTGRDGFGNWLTWK